MDKRASASESPLDIAVDRSAEIPIGVQLAWALRTRIRDGVFKAGQRLPGLREVAEATGVNVNTVRSVYQRLEQEGLIDSQQGSGTFVASTPLRPSPVATIAADAAREARETGVDPREVAAALYVSPGPPAHTPGRRAQEADDAADRRRVLREQIGALERTLGELEAKHPGVAPAAAETRRGIGPALLSVAELERVRTSLVRRLSTVQAAIDALGSEEQGEPVVEQGKRAGEKKLRSTTSGKGGARARPSTRPAPAGA